MTEIRKSRIGRPKVSRGEDREPKGTTTSVLSIVNQGITTGGRRAPFLLMGVSTAGVNDRATVHPVVTYQRYRRVMKPFA
jgi:hypothetical protein